MTSPYALGDFQANLLGGQPIFEIVPVAAMYPKVREIQFSTGVITTAQPTVIGIGIPGVKGVGLVDTRSVVPEDIPLSPNYQGLLQIATDWGIPPTVPANFYRQITLGATSGGGMARFYFPRGLAISPGTTLVAWCVTAAVIGNFLCFSVDFDA